jgi:xanthine dehydrogenase accessory factor
MPMATVHHALEPTWTVGNEDSRALLACATHGGALCTVIGIDGAWSRSLGAQLAVLPDGSTIGSLADGCLERALAAEVARDPAMRTWRIGKGSGVIDFRLPCGSGVDILLEPRAMPFSVRHCAAELAARRPALRAVSVDPGITIERTYLPNPRLLVLGTGPEVAALAELCHASKVDCTIGSPAGDRRGDGRLALGRVPNYPVDPFTAVVALFHDHEWERGILPWALGTPAFYIGAQGGLKTREYRLGMLRAAGCAEPAIGRLVSPVGCIPGAKTPLLLALSILTDVMFRFEALRPPLGIVEG